MLGFSEEIQCLMSLFNPERIMKTLTGSQKKAL